MKIIIAILLSVFAFGQKIEIPSDKRFAFKDMVCVAQEVVPDGRYQMIYASCRKETTKSYIFIIDSGKWAIRMYDYTTAKWIVLDEKKSERYLAERHPG